MAFQFACQTITFGPTQCDHFPEILPVVAQAGYDGVEIGFRHIAKIPPAELQRMLKQNGLVLVASHLGGNLEDTAQAEGEKKMIDEVLDYLNAMGTKFLMYSGLKHNSDEQFAADIAMVNRAAAACRARGVRLLYHNHNWEFANDWRAMNGILAQSSADLGFCPDVGWVRKAGVDVIGFLDKVKPRIGAIHYKDFYTVEGKVDTCVLGLGITPFPEVSRWLRANLPELWVIAEQDKADEPPADAVRKNVEYMKRVTAA